MKKTKHTKNKEVSNKKVTRSTSPWMIVSIVLAVLLIAVLVLGLTGLLSSGSDGDGISQSAAEAKANQYVSLISTEDMPITITDVVKDEGIYRIDISVSGQTESWYMSPTGDLLFPSAFTLSDIENIVGAQPPANDVNVNLEGVHTLGDGEVMMVEYSSATCPVCARFANEVYPLIKSEYIDTNKITYVYKHFIRNDVDVIAANAMECAGDQGAFFEYKELVYSNQDMLSQQSSYADWAEQLELDVAEFNACVESEKYTELASLQSREGQSNGVTGTPSFIINSRLIRGLIPFEEFETAIEAELAN